MQTMGLLALLTVAVWFLCGHCLQGMRVEVDFEGGKNAAGIYVHKKLPEAMGNSVAAFAHAVLSGGTQPGVWYPEEKEALAVRDLSHCSCLSSLLTHN